MNTADTINAIIQQAHLAHQHKVEQACGKPQEMQQIPPFDAADLFLQLAFLSPEALTALARRIGA